MEAMKREGGCILDDCVVNGERSYGYPPGRHCNPIHVPFRNLQRALLSMLQVWILGDDIGKEGMELGFLGRESMLGKFSDEVLHQIFAPSEIVLTIMELCKKGCKFYQSRRLLRSVLLSLTQIQISLTTPRHHLRPSSWSTTIKVSR